MTDLGLTHVALAVRDLEQSIGFYENYAGMKIVHRRPGPSGGGVAWMSDLTRPFAIVLIESQQLNDTPLGPFGHLGVAVASRDEVDRLAGLARAEGSLRSEPTDSGPIVGYWALIADPDGNTLEVAHGQKVALTIEDAASAEGDASHG